MPTRTLKEPPPRRGGPFPLRISDFRLSALRWRLAHRVYDGVQARLRRRIVVPHFLVHVGKAAVLTLAEAAAYCGMRRGDIVSTSLLAYRDGHLTWETNKNGKPLKIPVMGELRDILDGIVANYPAGLARRSERPSHDSAVFLSDIVNQEFSVDSDAETG